MAATLHQRLPPGAVDRLRAPGLKELRARKKAQLASAQTAAASSSGTSLESTVPPNELVNCSTSAQDDMLVDSESAPLPPSSSTAIAAPMEDQWRNESAMDFDPPNHQPVPPLATAPVTQTNPQPVPSLATAPVTQTSGLRLRLPARPRDLLPEPAPVVVDRGQSTTLPRVRLIVRDTMTTIKNSFGLWRRYFHRPSYDPDDSVSKDDLMDADGADTEDPRFLHEEPTAHRNKSHQLLFDWLYTGSSTKSTTELNRLVKDHLLHKDFSLEEVKNFNATRETQRLDAADAEVLGRFTETTIKLEVPSGDKTRPPKMAEVAGLHYRTLLSIIISAFGPESPVASQYHFTPFELYHTDDSGNEERVYSELYNTEAFINEHKKVQQASLPEDDLGCKREKVVAALMFWSDATHLANFGTAKLWPIYMFFGNLSKYVRAHPTFNVCHHVAYIPSLPDSFQDMMKEFHSKWGTQQKEILAHCRRELMQAVWAHLLDDDFLKAYKYGIVIKCHDGIERRIYPRIFTYSADYPEKVLLATIKDKGTNPCPRCLVHKSKLDKMGMLNDLKFRLRNPRKYLAYWVALARDLIYNKGIKIGGDAIKRILFSTSSVPTKNAFVERLGKIDKNFDVHSMLVVDFLHEFELGVWKNFFTHLVRILHAAESNGRLVATLDERYRQIPHFGTTIRTFANNASEMKKLAARDFEDLLQCSIPVFEGLLPEPHNKRLLKLLYRMAEFHAFAKLRMHTESSLKHLEELTTELGNLVRQFEKSTCSDFQTFELPRETAARRRRHEQTPTGQTASAGPVRAQPRKLNLFTYKWHALGDYFRSIRFFGCLDGFSTQVGELAHRLVKRLYGLTNKRNHEKQIARRYRRMEKAHNALRRHKLQANQRRGGRTTDLPLPTDANPEDPEERFYVSPSTNAPVKIYQLMQTGKNDPAVKNFLPKLQDHILGRLLHREFDGDTHQSFSDDDRNSVVIRGDKMYSVQTCRVHYTSYDMQRQSDTINITSNRDIILQAPPPEDFEGDVANPEPFWYARVLGVYHAKVSSTHQSVPNGREPRSMSFLWVRWFGSELDYIHGFRRARLPKIGFVPSTDDYAFGFVNPKLVIRCAHLIPSYVNGRTLDLLPSVITRGRLKTEDFDWQNFYVNIFLDRDMVIRHFGGGIGHLNKHLKIIQTQQEEEEEEDPHNGEDDESQAEPGEEDDPENRENDLDEERARQAVAAIADDELEALDGADNDVPEVEGGSDTDSDSSETASESDSDDSDEEEVDDDGYASC